MVSGKILESGVSRVKRDRVGYLHGLVKSVTSYFIPTVLVLSRP